ARERPTKPAGAGYWPRPAAREPRLPRTQGAWRAASTRATDETGRRRLLAAASGARAKAAKDAGSVAGGEHASDRRNRQAPATGRGQRRESQGCQGRRERGVRLARERPTKPAGAGYWPRPAAREPRLPRTQGAWRAASTRATDETGRRRLLAAAS